MFSRSALLCMLMLIVEASLGTPTLGRLTAATVLIPGGEFEMGNHDGGAGDAPVHTVRIDPFLMDVFEVTSQEYADFLNAAFGQGMIEAIDGVVFNVDGNEPLFATSIENGVSRIHFFDSQFVVEPTKEDHPIVLVSWFGAATYANWRSNQVGLEPCYDPATWECDFSASGYRLPTEAEWELAARGGEHDPYFRYPWGDTIDGSQANYSSSGDPFDMEPSPETTPVGYYDGNQTPPGVDMANGYGLYDVAGNVFEWVNDWYSSSYYGSSPIDNPTGPATGSGRVVRGGGWDTGFSSCEVAGRFNLSPFAIHHTAIGIRLVCRSSGGNVPAASTWGLVIAALSILSAGAVVCAGRRPRHA